MLILAYPINEDIKIIANAQEIVQAFLNLLTNAVNAMPDGGRITIKTEFKRKEEFLYDKRKGLRIPFPG